MLQKVIFIIFHVFLSIFSETRPKGENALRSVFQGNLASKDIYVAVPLKMRTLQSVVWVQPQVDIIIDICARKTSQVDPVVTASLCKFTCWHRI